MRTLFIKEGNGKKRLYVRSKYTKANHYDLISDRVEDSNRGKQEKITEILHTTLKKDLKNYKIDKHTSALTMSNVIIRTYIQLILYEMIYKDAIWNIGNIYRAKIGYFIVNPSTYKHELPKDGKHYELVIARRKDTFKKFGIKHYGHLTDQWNKLVNRLAKEKGYVWNNFNELKNI